MNLLEIYSSRNDLHIYAHDIWGTSAVHNIYIPIYLRYRKYMGRDLLTSIFRNKMSNPCFVNRWIKRKSRTAAYLRDLPGSALWNLDRAEGIQRPTRM